jgi:hypothetical protein
MMQRSATTQFARQSDRDFLDRQRDRHGTGMVPQRMPMPALPWQRSLEEL